MKRFIALTGIAILGGAFCLGGNQATAQAPAQPQARPLQTRIALMNMIHVLKNYKKFQAIEDSIKKRSSQLEQSLEPYRTQLIKMKTDYSNPATPQAEKEKIEYKSRQLQLEASLKEDEAKKELIKMNGEAATQIYKEVEDAVNLYARANNIELVLFYNDAITAEDYYHPANLQRKLTQPAAVMPLFVTPGMDISGQIVANLNAKYMAGAPAAPAAPRHQ